MLADRVGGVASLQPVARRHEQLVAHAEREVRAVDVDKEVVLEQRHLERARDELGREGAVHLSVEREQHGHVVLEVLTLDVLLGLLDALVARARLEDVDGQAELSELRRGGAHGELRLHGLVVPLQAALQPVDRLHRRLVVRVALVVVDGEEGQGGFEQELVEADVQVARDDRPGALGQAVGVELQQRPRGEAPAVEPHVQLVDIDRRDLAVEDEVLVPGVLPACGGRALRRVPAQEREAERARAVVALAGDELEPPVAAERDRAGAAHVVLALDEVDVVLVAAQQRQEGVGEVAGRLPDPVVVDQQRRVAPRPRCDDLELARLSPPGVPHVPFAVLREVAVERLAHTLRRLGRADVA